VKKCGRAERSEARREGGMVDRNLKANAKADNEIWLEVVSTTERSDWRAQ
jgi:hypothetical protein